MILSVDYGETIAYSLFSLGGKHYLSGSCDDIYIALRLLQTFPVSKLVIEKNNFNDSHRFQRQIVLLEETCEKFNIPIDYVYPSTWKHSFAKSIKYRPDKHTVDSYRIGMYHIIKESKK